MLKSDQPPIRTLKHLEHRIGIKQSGWERLIRDLEQYYKPKEDIKIKPDGKIKVRYLDRPFGELKDVQTRILDRILLPVADSMPAGMLAGIPGRGHMKNLDHHRQKPVVVTLDIRRCFPSTGDHMVHKALIKHLGCGRAAAHILTDLTTRNGHIPQGAPTSNMVLNLAILDLFLQVEAIVKPHGIHLTLTVDDFALSGDPDKTRAVVGEVIHAVRDYGYAIKSSKTRVMSRRRAQVVTNILVNNEGRVTRQYYDRLRLEIIGYATVKRVITDHQLASLNGKIRYVSKLDTKQGEKLYRFTDRLLGVNLRKPISSS